MPLGFGFSLIARKVVSGGGGEGSGGGDGSNSPYGVKYSTTTIPLDRAPYQLTIHKTSNGTTSVPARLNGLGSGGEFTLKNWTSQVDYNKGEVQTIHSDWTSDTFTTALSGNDASTQNVAFGGSKDRNAYATYYRESQPLPWGGYQTVTYGKVKVVKWNGSSWNLEYTYKGYQNHLPGRNGKMQMTPDGSRLIFAYATSGVNNHHLEPYLYAGRSGTSWDIRQDVTLPDTSVTVNTDRLSIMNSGQNSFDTTNSTAASTIRYTCSFDAELMSYLYVFHDTSGTRNHGRVVLGHVDTADLSTDTLQKLWNNKISRSLIKDFIIKNSSVPIDSDAIGNIDSTYAVNNTNSTAQGVFHPYAQSLVNGLNYMGLGGDTLHENSMPFPLKNGIYNSGVSMSKNGRKMIISLNNPYRINKTTSEWRSLNGGHTSDINKTLHFSSLVIFERDSFTDHTWTYKQTINWYDSDTHDATYSNYLNRWVGKNENDSDAKPFFGKPILSKDGNAFVVECHNYLGDSEALSETVRFGAVNGYYQQRVHKRPGRTHFMIFNYDSDDAKYKMEKIYRWHLEDSDHVGFMSKPRSASDMTNRHIIYDYKPHRAPPTIACTSDDLKYIVIHAARDSERNDHASTGVFTGAYVLYDSENNY